MQYTVNIGDIEEALIFLGGEANTRAIQDRVLQIHCADEIPENYQSERTFRQTIQRKIEDYCPQAAGFDATAKEPKFIRIDHALYRHAAGSSQKEFLAIEEVEKIDGLWEGTTKSIWVNAYERNQTARKKCIDHHGYACIVCEFDFEKIYGELGKAFIHIHHITPLSEIMRAYEVDPIRDLVPLCANCHAMVHRVSPPLSIERLRENFKTP